MMETSSNLAMDGQTREPVKQQQQQRPLLLATNDRWRASQVLSLSKQYFYQQPLSSKHHFRCSQHSDEDRVTSSSDESAHSSELATSLTLSTGPTSGHRCEQAALGCSHDDCHSRRLVATPTATATATKCSCTNSKNYLGSFIQSNDTGCCNNPRASSRQRAMALGASGRQQRAPAVSSFTSYERQTKPETPLVPAAAAPTNDDAHKSAYDEYDEQQADNGTQQQLNPLPVAAAAPAKATSINESESETRIPATATSRLQLLSWKPYKTQLTTMEFQPEQQQQPSWSERVAVCCRKRSVAGLSPEQQVATSSQVRGCSGSNNNNNLMHDEIPHDPSMQNLQGIVEKENDGPPQHDELRAMRQAAAAAPSGYLLPPGADSKCNLLAVTCHHHDQLTSSQQQQHRLNHYYSIADRSESLGGCSGEAQADQIEPLQVLSGYKIPGGPSEQAQSDPRGAPSDTNNLNPSSDIIIDHHHQEPSSGYWKPTRSTLEYRASRRKRREGREQEEQEEKRPSLEEQLRQLLDLGSTLEPSNQELAATWSGSQKSSAGEKNNNSTTTTTINHQIDQKSNDNNNKLTSFSSSSSARMKKNNFGASANSDCKRQCNSSSNYGNNRRAGDGISQDERFMIFMMASKSTATNSNVERNARILKWLNNCKSAR